MPPVDRSTVMRPPSQTDDSNINAATNTNAPSANAPSASARSEDLRVTRNESSNGERSDEEVTRDFVCECLTPLYILTDLIVNSDTSR